MMCRPATGAVYHRRCPHIAAVGVQHVRELMGTGSVFDPVNGRMCLKGEPLLALNRHFVEQSNDECCGIERRPRALDGSPGSSDTESIFLEVPLVQPFIVRWKMTNRSSLSGISLRKLIAQLCKHLSKRRVPASK